MDLGNFKDLDFVTFFVVSIIIFILVIVTIIFLILSSVRKKNFLKQVSYESTSAYIYIINAQQNTILYFNKSDIKNKKTADLLSFYSKFHPNDSEKVKSWISSIMSDPTNAEQYLEADTLLEHGKKPCFSLLKLLKFDSNVGLIHIESRILKYYVPNNAPKAKKTKRVPTGIVKRSQIMSLIKNNKSVRGYTFCLRFFYAKKIFANHKIERHMTMTLKNTIYPFASASKTGRQILDEGGNELFLFDLKLASPEGAYQLANSIAHVLRKEMEVNAFSTYVSFTIGFVKNELFYQLFDDIIEASRTACISGQTNGKEIAEFERNVGAPSEMAKFTEQIDHILKNDVLKYMFRPILDSRQGRILGYFEYVQPHDSPFTNFKEMSKYASKINKNVDLFAIIAKHVIPKFASENHDPSVSLFLSVSMMDINHITDIIKDIPTSNKTSITFVFDEQEVNENASNGELLINALKAIKNDGFGLSLLLKDKDLLLDDNFYHMFDYFIVDSAMVGIIKKNNHIRLSIFTLIESLLKFERPIIATDLESWQSIELFIKSGIELISSEVLSSNSEHLLPIEKKRVEKVVGMTKKK